MKDKTTKKVWAFTIRPDQLEKLRKEKAASGLSMSFLVTKAIDAYFADRHRTHSRKENDRSL